jgi:hypothetical protein
MTTAKAKDRGVIFLGVFVTLVSLGGAFALGDYTLPPGEGDDGGDEWVEGSTLILLDGTVTEGSTDEQGVTLDQEKVTQIVVKLSWEDEPDADARHSNSPDTLGLDAMFEFGNETGENSNGEVTLTFTAPEDSPWNMKGKTIDIIISAVDCGDQQPLVPDPLGLRTIADGGNAYDIEVEVIYKTKGNADGQPSG